MKINSDLGYEPVTYSELTQDEAFWKGCQSCVNHEILMSKDRKNCLCTAMLYDPVEKDKPKWFIFADKKKIMERLIRIKQSVFIKKIKLKLQTLLF